MKTSEAQIAMLNSHDRTLPACKGADKLVEPSPKAMQLSGSFCLDRDNGPACPACKLIKKQCVYVHTSKVSHASYMLAATHAD